MIPVAVVKTRNRMSDDQQLLPITAKIHQQAWRLASHLDGMCGDTDPDLLDDDGNDLPDEIVKEEEPLFWACREAFELARTIKQDMARLEEIADVLAVLGEEVAHRLETSLSAVMTDKNTVHVFREALADYKRMKGTE